VPELVTGALDVSTTMQIHQQLAAAAAAAAAVVLWRSDVNTHTGNSVTGDTLQAHKQGNMRREQLAALPMTAQYHGRLNWYCALPSIMMTEPSNSQLLTATQVGV